MFCFMTRATVAADTFGALPSAISISSAVVIGNVFLPLARVATCTIPPTISATSVGTTVLPLSERCLRSDLKPTFSSSR